MNKMRLFCCTLLVATVMTGMAMQSLAQNVDCRTCHVQNGAAGAKDFSAIYAKLKTHHPVGVRYPFEVKPDSNLKLPSGKSGNITFFDTNGNGLPDSDEIQLFGATGPVTVECSSCHIEHGISSAGPKASANSYLRIDNRTSALCTICHSI